MKKYLSALTDLLAFKELRITDISKVDDYLFVGFECGQKLLMDKKKIL